MRAKPIIAVFGRKDHLHLAEALGAAIAASQCVVLSGGTGPGDATVKERAIRGARTSPWIGVDQHGPIGTEPEAGGIVVRTGLGHRSNYLEAALCDAAIGIAGGDGTTSEITSRSRCGGLSS